MQARAVLGALLICGCASSSGIQSHGSGTYRVEAGSEFGLAQAKSQAWQEANAFCQSSGERAAEISSSVGAHLDALGDRVETYALTFQCGGSGGRVASVPVPPPSPVQGPTCSQGGQKRFVLPRR